MTYTNYLMQFQIIRWLCS